MISTKTFFVLVALSVSQLALAETFWLQFKSPRVYRDVTLVCKPETYETGFYLEGKFSGGRAVWAQFIRNPLPQYRPYTAKVILTREELSRIQFEIDEAGRYWIKKLSLGGRLLNWILRKTGKDYCPPQELRTLTSPLQFVFDTEATTSGEQMLLSDVERFSGTRKDGGAYDGKMKLQQKQYEIPHRRF